MSGVLGVGSRIMKAVNRRRMAFGLEGRTWLTGCARTEGLIWPLFFLLHSLLRCFITPGHFLDILHAFHSRSSMLDLSTKMNCTSEAPVTMLNHPCCTIGPALSTRINETSSLLRHLPRPETHNSLVSRAATCPPVSPATLGSEIPPFVVM